MSQELQELTKNAVSAIDLSVSNIGQTAFDINRGLGNVLYGIMNLISTAETSNKTAQQMSDLIQTQVQQSDTISTILDVQGQTVAAIKILSEKLNDIVSEILCKMDDKPEPAPMPRPVIIPVIIPVPAPQPAPQPEPVPVPKPHPVPIPAPAPKPVPIELTDYWYDWNRYCSGNCCTIRPYYGDKYCRPVPYYGFK